MIAYLEILIEDIDIVVELSCNMISADTSYTNELTRACYIPDGDIEYSGEKREEIDQYIADNYDIIINKMSDSLLRYYGDSGC